MTLETITGTNGTEAAVTILESPRKLDIGAGAKRDEGYDTMDLSPAFSPDIEHDLTRFPWPVEDGYYDQVRCWHVLEHLERKYLIPVMNEMHRILKPGGIASIEVPIFPYWTAIADPTHVSFFVRQTFWYFINQEMRGGNDYAEHRALYGIEGWNLKAEARDELGSVLRVELEKP